MVNKFLFPLALNGNLHLLVHQKVCPIFRDLLAHVKREALAFNHARSVSNLVPVEALHISNIPAFPFLHFSIKVFADGGKAQLFQLIIYVQAVTPILLNTRSSAYLVASIRWLFSSG